MSKIDTIKGATSKHCTQLLHIGILRSRRAAVSICPDCASHPFLATQVEYSILPVHPTPKPQVLLGDILLPNPYTRCYSFFSVGSKHTYARTHSPFASSLRMRDLWSDWLRIISTAVPRRIKPPYSCRNVFFLVTHLECPGLSEVYNY